jgi:ankyrin repeat protein
VPQDVDVNSRDANGWTALHYCAFLATQQHYTLAKALLEAGAGTPIHMHHSSKAIIQLPVYVDIHNVYSRGFIAHDLCLLTDPECHVLCRAGRAEQVPTDASAPRLHPPAAAQERAEEWITA